MRGTGRLPRRPGRRVTEARPGVGAFSSSARLSDATDVTLGTTALVGIVIVDAGDARYQVERRRVGRALGQGHRGVDHDQRLAVVLPAQQHREGVGGPVEPLDEVLAVGEAARAHHGRELPLDPGEVL